MVWKGIMEFIFIFLDFFYKRNFVGFGMGVERIVWYGFYYWNRVSKIWVFFRVDVWFRCKVCLDNDVYILCFFIY